MTTFLWMLYLPCTLFITLILFFDTLKDIIKEGLINDKHLLYFSIISFFWSIWYFYYLH